MLGQLGQGAEVADAAQLVDKLREVEKEKDDERLRRAALEKELVEVRSSVLTEDAARV